MSAARRQTRYFIRDHQTVTQPLMQLTIRSTLEISDHLVQSSRRSSFGRNALNHLRRRACTRASEASCLFIRVFVWGRLLIQVLTVFYATHLLTLTTGVKIPCSKAYIVIVRIILAIFQDEVTERAIIIQANSKLHLQSLMSWNC